MSKVEKETVYMDVAENLMDEEIDSDAEIEMLMGGSHKIVHPSLRLVLEHSPVKDVRRQTHDEEKRASGQQLLLKKAMSGNVGLVSPATSGSGSYVSLVS